MKLQIRDQLRLIAYPETTFLTPPFKNADTKGAKKRKKPAKSDNSTTRSPSYWEHIDAQFPDSQASQSKPSIPKRKTAHIGNFLPNATPPRSIPFIQYMPHFMHSYIEDIVDVKPDGHCGFRVVAHHLGKGEDNQGLDRLALIRELTMFRSDYLQIYGTEKRLKYILDGLYPPKVMPKRGVAPLDKWLTFPDMGHIVATTYNKVVVELTNHTIGHSETFFPIRGRPPSDPFSRIMCIGLVPNHFVYVKLKAGCPLPHTCKEWKNIRAPEAETWEDKFLDQMLQFDQLMENEKGDMKKTNEDDPINLS
jgi:histone-lysine N-methyltransferase SETD2